MSQNLARLNMALAGGGGAEQAAAHAAQGFGNGGAHLAHPDIADGLAPPELTAAQLAAARAAWAAGSEAATQHRVHAAPHAPSASELLLRRGGSSQLQPIQIGPPHGSRSAAVAAAESRLPPSPSDAAASTDLRRAALLRALQRRTGSGSFLGTAAMSRSVEDSDASMASMSTGDDGETDDADEGIAGAEPHAADAATPHAQPEPPQPQPQQQPADPDGAIAWDDAPMSPPLGSAAAAQAAQAPPLPPELRLGPHWQLRG